MCEVRRDTDGFIEIESQRGGHYVPIGSSDDLVSLVRGLWAGMTADEREATGLR